MTVFHERFKVLKSGKNATYKDIADELQISARAVQHYADGKRFPDFHGLVKLADYFDVSIDYLVRWSDVPARR